MGLGAPRTKQRFGLDPRNTNWSNDLSRFGHRHLQKYGWKPGQGLGLTNNATTSHIKVVIKQDNTGLGASLARKSAKKDEFDSGECTGLDVFQRLLGRLNGKEAEVNEQMDELQRNRIINGRWGINFVRGDVLKSTWDAKEGKMREGGKDKDKTDKKDKKKKDRKHKDKKKHKDEKKHKDKEKSRKRKRDDAEVTRESMLAPRDRSETPPVPSGRMALRQKWIQQKRLAVVDSKALQEIFMVK
ncbi:hypothetical protein KL918_002959 [Ogataea parapolymorpha]|uniref:Protein PXR1 n=1 Tax=Ogataea parapolymorpha (strain ATCC 26012 / BCRC 20466 / JCM 22074 / NRRL Y-7560 / DL-1) TaxID=871575 RepID=W1Q9R6_OGAPD|nr:Protein PXR1 [Ogataea parapolymorpha DL-1]ESW97585.1 Protein PXR1 [Ogataea parapolymorpha DL-1]KAG7866764.1 hypothetical protein KL918_002959 [Ogataea parapolymorpha]KAG7871915.1 hypothetical protein KL916_003518 [Ogataea parapolymorpha]